jgi:hypothetical protein
MADIVVENPITKQRRAFFKISDEIAAVLLHAGIAEHYVKPADPVVVNPWFVSKGRFGDTPMIVLRMGSEDIFYTGKPELAVDWKPRGEAPPAHVIAQYAALYAARPNQVFVDLGYNATLRKKE